LNLPALTTKSAIWIVPAIDELAKGSSVLSYVLPAAIALPFKFLNETLSLVLALVSTSTRILTSDVFDT
jgi:hypothetical protein